MTTHDSSEDMPWVRKVHEVWRQVGREVALKVISSRLIANSEAVERFDREMQTAARLSHSNIVTAYDADHAGGLHFLAMEYVDGVDLSEVVKQHGPLPVTEACECIRQAAMGLQHAHEQRMVHRDIKPQNLMVEGDGLGVAGQKSYDKQPPLSIKILDFGLAGFANEAGADGIEETGQPASEELALGQLTALGTMMGTPDYISPEQSRDARSVDIRSDIYSLGCTFYFLLTGRPPFEGDNVMLKLEAHRKLDPEPIESIRVDLPVEVAEVVRRMMSKKPAERFQTPAEVAEALAPFVERYRDPSHVTPRGQPRRRSVGHRAAVALMLFFVLAVIAAAVIYVVTDRGTLVIQTQVPDARVVIRQKGKDVQTIDISEFVKAGNANPAKPGNGVRVEVNLRSGDYEVELLGNDSSLKVINGKITVRRGDLVIVKISKQPNTIPQGQVAAPELRYISDNFFAAIVLQPRRIFSSPIANSTKMFVFSAFSKDLGVDMKDVEQLVLLVSSPTKPGELSAMVRFVHPTDASAIAARMFGEFEKKTSRGSMYYVNRRGIAAFVVDKSTIIRAPENTLLQMISADHSRTSLARQLQTANLQNDLTVAISFNEQSRKAMHATADAVRAQISRKLATDLELVADAIEYATIGLNFSIGGSVTLSLRGKDKKAADTIEQLCRAGVVELQALLIRLGADKLTEQMTDPKQLALKTAFDLLVATKVSRQGDLVVATSKAPEDFSDMLLLSVVMPAQAASQILRSKNRLKRIGLAMYNYHDTHQSFAPGQSRPDDQFDAKGKPLLSWRVHILPMIGDDERALFKRFRLDEPWDSEHNIELLGEMPSVFKTTDDANKTTILAVVGPGTIYEGKRGFQFKDITDGSSNTILAVIAGDDKAVPWTKPVDLPFNPDDPISEFGKLADGGFSTVFADGSVYFLRRDLNPEFLRALLTRAGGERVDKSKLNSNRR
ncbi:MAG: protein kinase [Planctomycetes bacterium]|nr:protein kinase [Planctomycetota bacterium]